MDAVPKKTAAVASPAERSRVARFRVQRAAERARLLDIVFRSKHLENMLLILHANALRAEQPEMAQQLLDPEVVRALAAGTPGGKKSARVAALRDRLAEDPLFQDFLEVAKTLKEKNVHALTKKCRAAFRSCWTKRKDGDLLARSPRPRKLAKVTCFAIPVDQCALSLKRKNCLRLNLEGKMESFHLPHVEIERACGAVSAVQAVEVVLAHGEVYFHLIYRRPLVAPAERPVKHAGIDLGLKNLAALFVDDATTPSLVLEGARQRQYNAACNRRLSKLLSRRDQVTNALGRKPPEAVAATLAAAKRQLSKQIAVCYRRRGAWFTDVFHKLACRILEYCEHAGVTDLHVSRNLGFLKQQAGLNRKFNQKFCQIPMVKLLDHLIDKGEEHGIRVNDSVDEAYSSKVSCLQGDVVAVQAAGKRIAANPDLAQRQQERARLSAAFGGRRDRRDRYVDRKTGKKFLADLNGAVNHIKLAVARDYSWLAGALWKLANPLVIKCESMFLDLRFARFGDKEERPESRQQSWLYATWSQDQPCLGKV